MSRRPGPFRRFARAVRKRLPWLRGGDPPPEPRFPDEESLVPTGPPRRHPPSVTAAVEPPTGDDPLVYSMETEAVGTAMLDEPPGEPPAPASRRFRRRRAA